MSNSGETRNWQECSCCDCCCCCWHGQSERTSYQRCRADCSEDNHDRNAHPTCSRPGMCQASQTELCVQRSHEEPMAQNILRTALSPLWPRLSEKKVVWDTKGVQLRSAISTWPRQAGRQARVNYRKVSTRRSDKVFHVSKCSWAKTDKRWLGKSTTEGMVVSVEVQDQLIQSSGAPRTRHGNHYFRAGIIFF